MTTVNVLSGGAAQGLVRGVTEAFKAQTGLGIDGEFGAVGVMADKLRASTPADLVILTQALLARLAEEKLVVPSSITDVGRVETALAVRSRDAKVTVKTEADLRGVLRGADAIYVPDTKASTAGQHFAKVLDQLGIGYEVASRLKIFPNGATAMRELAASGAAKPIGCTQATEIIATDRIALSGALPPGCELVTMYTAGVTMRAAHPTEAAALIALLTGADRKDLRQRAGFTG
ncbi:MULTISPECIES: molybdate ABC transporter substrate-binding protein [Bradyrhizobium]|uniref:Molybdate transport system substrate-binding protein n=1 Tax=Bradyrhizobium ottawaense TaxID=931866 RepID=A0ABV4G5T4_9BRAD|nr:substrate-binding domain-containing protein [Bradyrhizobium ottawaense]MDA9413502.1 molybdate ABC transporter substrate-binding protein [Bradyrhizobium sp. CCBAU 25360]MDA9485584.1 molybdate ABC transporter substrate-binding protein [Bradyrhizobium sp. CCBAU 11445]MBR1291351.1 substrate-binding domain-containing protein [Bradyrhizobium ottawaense]PDT69568.1 molybdate ABC transporter substrate-binding protein [Bradyrhizobium ottawaense]WQN81289.1 substrate-binding domain-containing protein [